MLVLPGIIAYALFPDRSKRSRIMRIDAGAEFAADGISWVGDGGAACGGDGGDEFGVNSASTLVTLDFYKKIGRKRRNAVGEFWTDRDGWHGIARIAVGAVHSFAERAALHLFAERTGVHQSAIAACFVFGILWPRLNGQGAISSLLVGFVLGASRFVFEVLDKKAQYKSGAIRWLVDMNFLHYAIFMFVVCSSCSLA